MFSFLCVQILKSGVARFKNGVCLTIFHSGVEFYISISNIWEI